MDSNITLRQAEQAVNNSIAKFEAAMEDLASRVEDTSERVQNLVDSAQRPVAELIEMKNRIHKAVRPLIQDMRTNPAPWLMTAALLSVSFFFFKYRQLETRSPERALN